ncbi:MAG TPA: MFS transporter [Anaerolineales bacterium]
MRKSAFVKARTDAIEVERSAIIRSAAACLIGTFVLRMAAAVMGNMVHLYFAKIDRELFPISFTMRSTINAAFFLPELIGSPLLGSWSDKYGRRLFILLGPLTGAIAVQITALTTLLPLLALTRFLEGLSTASAIPATLGYLSALTSRDEVLRARVMGLFEVATFGGTISGILLGGPLFDLFQNHAFTFNSLIYLASLGILYFGMLEGRDRATAPVSDTSRTLVRGLRAFGSALEHAYGGIRTALTSGYVWRFAPAWLAINMLPGLWINNVTGQVVNASDKFPDQLIFGILGDVPHPDTTISLAGGVVLGLFTLGVLIWTLLINRFRRTSLMLFCASGLPVIVGALYLVNHTATAQDPLIPLYLGVAGLALMVVSGFTPAALTYLAEITEHSPVNRGAIMGLYTVLFGLGQFLGEFFGGPFGDWRGVDGLLVFTLILGLIAISAVALLSFSERS